jgi:CHASE3 domain sensor protein
MTKGPRGVSGVFVIMAIVVVSSTIVTYWIGTHVLRTHNLAVFHREVIAQSAQLLSTLKDAETGQRGFTITGDEKYLEPYNAAVARLPEELNTLKRMERLRFRSRSWQRLSVSPRKK